MKREREKARERERESLFVLLLLLFNGFIYLNTATYYVLHIVRTIVDLYMNFVVYLCCPWRRLKNMSSKGEMECPQVEFEEETNERSVIVFGMG